jgi:hypothetical protein
VHTVGVAPLLDALGRFGWLSVPAPAHATGEANPGESRYDTGRLGCGLAGCRITPLHAAQLAATLVNGELVAPRWIERVWDAEGRELPLPQPAPGRPVLSAALTEELRSMLVETTRSGTARRAFRKRNGQPLLGSVRVAGKTGSLSGKNPTAATSGSSAWRRPRRRASRSRRSWCRPRASGARPRRSPPACWRAYFASADAVMRRGSIASSTRRRRPPRRSPTWRRHADTGAKNNFAPS